MGPSFQEIVLALHRFWAGQGCLLVQPHDVEVGAGTMNPMTFLRVLGPEPWRVAYVEPSRRPADARYGENPNRLYQHHQYQVILKPAPEDVVDVYLESLRALGLDLGEHDVRLVEDNWEAPTLGAWGLGWEIWLDGMEITQFTYFQQVGGLELNPIAVEITYGLERIAAYLQGKDDVFSVEYGAGVTYGEIFRTAEYEHSKYSFEVADVGLLGELFAAYEREARRTLEEGLVLPAYDYVLRMSHTFNVLDARGAVSVSERAGLIARVRRLANEVARAYVAQRESLGYPLLRAEAKGA
ncbi:glycine--tRNA ligase subunit alpha [Brockia lithotrophica]|uniref:Glycine--tRNA ligase alpha subunit n=1 Tax=Brockia lithotrophica TaxID=933949 RepID=A0A660LBK9_9BACL|nr:glycine--tRNA ligase subunit alpha [Brockia lithotrophica]RKQ88990.1 glycyl-tRNA synthetase alpha chain [Brockia lithotrophica]